MDKTRLWELTTLLLRARHYEVYYKRSRDGGDHWLPKKRLTFDAQQSAFPSIAVWGTTSATIHVVSQIGDSTLPRNDEFYYRRVHWTT